MTRDERLLWIASHISGVTVTISRDDLNVRAVEPAEIGEALRELVRRRKVEELEAARTPPEYSASRLARWFRSGGRQ